MADNLPPSYSAGGKGRKTTPAGVVAHACTPRQAKAKELLREEASLSYIVGDPGLPELHYETPPPFLSLYHHLL